MGKSMIDGVILTPLSIIDVSGGDVLHAMKSTDPGFSNFGEAYFSTVKPNVVKAWKRHKEMTLNMIVPIGAIKFVIYDDREYSKTKGLFQDIVLSKKEYYRLTVPPMLWMGFQGVAKDVSMLLNIANIEHKQGETDRKIMENISYDWEMK